MEQWLPLASYPGYEASDQGRIRNTNSGAVLAVSRVGADARPYVGLSVHRRQVKRGLALLICSTFVPRPKREDWDTPIHLDGDVMNCRVNNLQWRPRWFALKHTEQFRLRLVETEAIRNINTGAIYENAWSVVFSHGVLYNDVIMSIVNKTWVFPLMQYFEWVDPD